MLLKTLSQTTNRQTKLFKLKKERCEKDYFIWRTTGVPELCVFLL